MDNEVIIHVRVDKANTKAGFEAVGKESVIQSKAISEKFADSFSDNFTTRVTTRMRDSRGRFIPVGQEIGNALGDSISQRVSEKVTTRLRDSRGRFISAAGGDGGDGGRGRSGGDGGKGGDANVNVDVNKQSLLSRLFGAGKDGAASFAAGFRDSIGQFFSGDIVSMIVKAIAGGGLAIALAPVLGAAFTSATGLALGGGAIAIGIVGAFKDPRIQLAAKGMLDEVKGLFADFSSNFKGPLEEFFAPSNGGGGGLVGVLGQISPMISQLGKDLAPVAQNLGDGIIGFLQNALPPILDGIRDSAPIVNALADKLPKLGESIGRFFDRITSQSPEASVFLADLLDGVVALIDIFGVLITGATSMYVAVRRVFIGLVMEIGKVAEAAAIAFGWVPGLGPKLQGANEKIKDFVKRSNNNLKGMDKDVTINVRFRILGQAAASAAIRTARLLNLSGAIGDAHGGITGAATGGLHGGPRWVGEHGPELVELPPGTRVNSNADSMRMASGAGQSMGQLLVQLVLDGKVLVEQLVEPTRELVRGQGSGSVQGFYGQPGVA